ncbi:MAG: class I SAM-dependent methyltransferase [Planctomycetes bacterium]|nr:class I SAM-dependent methyltransferase [Planctomycetota bacterium]
MKTISINNHSTYQKEEEFLQGQFNVISRSGLHPTEKQLIEHLGNLKKEPNRILFLENRSAVSSIIARSLFPNVHLHIYHHDQFYTNKISQNLKQNHEESVEVSCSANLPDEGPYDLILLQVTQSISAELVSHYLQECHAKLTKGGLVWVACEKKNVRTTTSQLKKFFGECTTVSSSHSTLLISRKTKDLKKQKDYSCKFKLELPQNLKIPLISRPGVFSHRRVDGGAQALAEVLEVQKGDHILDMGCGCGLVGISAALRSEDSQLSLLDSNAIAIQCSRENAELNGLKNISFFLNDQGQVGDENFDLYLGNPPYFSDQKISNLFIETAARVLNDKGRAYFVAKNMTENEIKAKTLFQKVKVFSRRTYQIMLCENKF